MLRALPVTAAVALLVLLPAADAAPRKLPNLVVMKTSAAPGGAPPGSVFEATWRIKNVGSRVARISHTDVVLSDDSRRDPDDLVVTRIGAQEREPGTVQRFTRRMRLPAAALPGEHQLIACADSKDVVRERKERDNCRVIAASFVVYSG